MSLLETVLCEAASQVPLASVFLVAIVFLVRYTVGEIGAAIDRNTVALHHNSEALRDHSRDRRRFWRLLKRLCETGDKEGST